MAFFNSLLAYDGQSHQSDDAQGDANYVHQFSAEIFVGVSHALLVH